MSWTIETLEYFDTWFHSLSVEEKEDVLTAIYLLQEKGASLPRPWSDTLKGSEFNNMKELRIQHKGKPYRVLYAFDPRRCGILILGGNKGGDKRWYKKHIPIADRLYQEHLDTLERS